LNIDLRSENTVLPPEDAQCLNLSCGYSQRVNPEKFSLLIIRLVEVYLRLNKGAPAILWVRKFYS